MNKSILTVTLLLLTYCFSNAQVSSTNTTTTMFKPTFVPSWAAEAVWYQIFPDRFRDGDPKNQPTLASLKGAWPHDLAQPWQPHPWGADWYKQLPYEAEHNKPIWHHLQRRRYGGDLAGIIEQLDYLQELGVNALYLNPIFYAPSSHKYDAICYHHVDPFLGPNPEGDIAIIEKEVPHDPSTWQWTSADLLLIELIQQVHKRGMRIILDGVFNHIGIENFAFKDIQAKQQQSYYKDWIAIESWDDPKAGTTFSYKGWFGVRELPEWQEDDNGLVAGPRTYVFDITRRWMDPNNDGNPDDGIDGWRLDVAFCVKHPFWKEWRTVVRSINPQAYLTAEVIEPPKDIIPYVHGDEFDAVMNYNFAFTAAEYMIAQPPKRTAAQFDAELRSLREMYPPEVSYAMQNLFASHDAARLASHIVNANLSDYRNWSAFYEASKAGNPAWNTRKPTQQEYAVQRLFAVLQMTYIGAPMLYYGDEVGMWGANDPCCRKPMLWGDISYEDESVLPEGKPREESCSVAPDLELLKHYKELISIRKSRKELMVGDYKLLHADTTGRFLVFERSANNRKTIVALNPDNQPKTFSLTLQGLQTTYASEGSFTGNNTITVNGVGFIILTNGQ